MKKIIYVILVVMMPMVIKAVSIKEVELDIPKEVSAKEVFDVKVNLVYDDLKEKQNDDSGIALVAYELIFDDELLGISDYLDDGTWINKIYKIEDKKYLILSTLGKQIPNDKKCSDKVLYCADYQSLLKLYAKKEGSASIKVGDIEIGLLPVVKKDKELSKEDVILINSNGKIEKEITLKKSNSDTKADIKEATILEKSDILVTKQMVLDSKDNTYSVSEKDNYLENIIIEGYDINFKKYINEYTLEVASDVNKLDVKALLSNKDASFKIIGNDDIEKNNNEIKVEVTSTNGDVNTYTIKVLKEVKKEKEDKDETTNFLNIKIDKDKIDYQLIGIIVGGLLLLIIIIKIIKKLLDRKLEKAVDKL